MITSLAPLILVSFTSIGVMVWLISFRYLVNSPVVAARRKRDEFTPNAIKPAVDAGPTRIVGAAEIEGDPAEVSRKLASVLARDSFLPPAPIQILERTDERITFRTADSDRKPKGEIRLNRISSTRTRVDYCVDFPSLKTFLLIAWIIQALGLIVLAVAYWLMQTFVIHSGNPAISGQSVQMVQMVHFLWPPFVFAYRYRQGYRQVLTKMDTMLNNLPHAIA